MLPVYELPAQTWWGIVLLICQPLMSLCWGRRALGGLIILYLGTHHPPVVSSDSLYVFMPTCKAAHLCISCGSYPLPFRLSFQSGWRRVIMYEDSRADLGSFGATCPMEKNSFKSLFTKKKKKKCVEIYSCVFHVTSGNPYGLTGGTCTRHWAWCKSKEFFKKLSEKHSESFQRTLPWPCHFKSNWISEAKLHILVFVTRD